MRKTRRNEGMEGSSETEKGCVIELKRHRGEEWKE